MNYAALLGVIAAAAFAVPLLAAAGAALGLPRGTGFVVSLSAAVALTSYWWVRARRELEESTTSGTRGARRRYEPGQKDGSPPAGGT